MGDWIMESKHLRQAVSSAQSNQIRVVFRNIPDRWDWREQSDCKRWLHCYRHPHQRQRHVEYWCRCWHPVSHSPHISKEIKLGGINISIFLFMLVRPTYLTIEQWRIVVHIGYLHSEGAHTLQTGITLIGCLYRDRDKFTIITLTIEDFVSGNLPSLLVHSEFGALLIGLLYNRVFNLQSVGDRNMQDCLMIDTILLKGFLRRCPQHDMQHHRVHPNPRVHWTWAWQLCAKSLEISTRNLSRLA